MAAEFRFQASSPTKPGLQAPVEAITPASDLIQSWGGKINKAAYHQVLSTPGEQLIGAKTLFSSPQATPTGATREDALEAVETRLEEKLAAEKREYDAVEARLKGTKLTEEQSTALGVELDKRGERQRELQQKLGRTRFTLTELRASCHRLAASTDRVQGLQAELSRESQVAEDVVPEKGALKKPTCGRSSNHRASLESLRGELSSALGVMAAASRRVEQMEAITDLLLGQLAEREAELGAAQRRLEDVRGEHAQEVQGLNAERGQLIDELGAARGRLAELETRDERLARELAAASSRERGLEAAKTENELAFATERAKLAEAISQAQHAQQELMTKLHAKENELSSALEKIGMVGTPIGEGAKVVLPMALRRIKDTQEALKAEQVAREGAQTEAERAQRERDEEVKALEARLALLDSERARQVAEKNASLESLVRAAAAATTEAAKKAEALQSLMRERDALEVRAKSSEARCLDLATRLEESEAVAGELQRQVAELTALSTQAERGLQVYSADLDAVRAELQDSAGHVERLQKELEQASAERKELQCDIANNMEALALLKHEHDALTLRLQDLETEKQRQAAEHAEAFEVQRRDAEEKVSGIQKLVADLESTVSSLREGKATSELALAAARAELGQARVTGTPVGEGAKTVSRMAFARIKELQEALDSATVEAQGAREEADQARKALEAERARAEASVVAQAKLEAHVAAFVEREAELLAQASEKEEVLITEMRRAQEELRCERDELQLASVASDQKAKDLEKALDKAQEAEKEALVRTLDLEAALAAQHEGLESATAEAAGKVVALQAIMAANQEERDSKLAAAQSENSALRAEVCSLNDAVAHLGHVFHQADAIAGELGVEKARNEENWERRLHEAEAALKIRVEENEVHLAAEKVRASEAAQRCADLQAQLEQARAESLQNETAIREEMQAEVDALKARLDQVTRSHSGAKDELELLEKALKAAAEESDALAAAHALHAAREQEVVATTGNDRKDMVGELEAVLEKETRARKDAEERVEHLSQQCAELGQELAALKQEVAAAKREALDKASFLGQATDALALQKEAMDLSQKLADERVHELEATLEKAKEQASVTAAEVQEAQRAKRDAERSKRQNTELAVAFSNARTKIESLQVEVNALRSEKVLLVKQLEKQRQELVQQEDSRQEEPVSTSAVIEATKKAMEAGRRAVQGKLESTEKTLADTEVRAKALRAQLGAQQEASRKLHRQLADQQRRSGLLQLAASLAFGALVALSGAWVTATMGGL